MVGGGILSFVSCASVSSLSTRPHVQTRLLPSQAPWNSSSCLSSCAISSSTLVLTQCCLPPVESVDWDGCGSHLPCCVLRPSFTSALVCFNCACTDSNSSLSRSRRSLRLCSNCLLQSLASCIHSGHLFFPSGKTFCFRDNFANELPCFVRARGLFSLLPLVLVNVSRCLFQAVKELLSTCSLGGASHELRPVEP